MHNLLDECFRKTLTSSLTGPNSILIKDLAVLPEKEESGLIIKIKSLKEIGNIYPGSAAPEEVCRGALLLDSYHT